jgi:DNA-binding NtrC family response regulator
MAARVLLALADDPGPLADALRAAGFVLERCPPARLKAAAASFEPDACVVAFGRTRLAGEASELLAQADRPAIVALVDAPDGRAASEAYERGLDAVLPLGASPDWIAGALRSAIAQRALLAELERRRAEQRATDELAVLGSSQSVRRLRDALQRVASTPRTTVLVTGETGCGLESVARLVHARSARCAAPLAELRACAQDDAEQARFVATGGALWSRACGGTLIVHEVAEAGRELQAALAEALESGGASASAGGVRLVATSSSDLAGEVQAGRFGEDLLYKLNVLSLAVPPFSERSADVAEIAQRAAERLRRGGSRVPQLEGASLAAIAQRSWPGGLPQLLAALELGLRAGAGGVAHSTTAASFLATTPWVALEQDAVLPAAPRPPPVRSLRSAEESLIRQVLAETGGNKLRSAEILGIHRTTLYHKLREYGIEA